MPGRVPRRCTARPGRPAGGRAPAGRPAAAGPRRPPGPPPGRRCRGWPGARRRSPRTARPGTSRGTAPGSMGSSRPAALTSSGGASLPRLVTNASWARARSAWACWRSLSGPASAMSSRSAATSKAPAWILAWAAASARPARRAGSSVSVAACFRKAAAAARPPRACARPAERSSSAATSSSGPGAAWARCQARRSGSSRGSVASARARCASLPVRGGRRAVGRRADQRMAEPQPGAELGQPGLGRGRRGLGADPEPGGGPPDQGRVAGRVGRRRAAAAAGSAPGGRRGGAGSSPRCCPPAGPRRAARTRPPAPRASGPGAAPAGPAGCPGSRRRSGRGPARQSGRAAPRPAAARASASASPADGQLRQPGQVAARVPGGEHQADRLGAEAAGHEREDLAEAWSSHCPSSTGHTSGCSAATCGQQAQHGQADQEPVRRRPRAHAEHGAQGIALRGRQRLQAVQHRRAQLMQSGERELHLRLDAGGPRHPAARRLPGQVVQQRRLADARLAVHHQRPALARAKRPDQPVQHAALGAAACQPDGAAASLRAPAQPPR